MLSVSVVIPCFNCAHLVGETIDSVLAQKYRPQQIIVVNDGSTDHSLKALEAYGNAITVVNQENAGLSAARNAGARVASTDWLAFLDADDLYEPEFLAASNRLLQRFPAVSAIFTEHIAFAAETGPWIMTSFEQFVPELRQHSEVVEDDLCLLGSRGFRLVIERNGAFAPSSLIVRKEVFDRAGGFHEEIRYGAEDLDFYCQALAGTSIGVVARPLLRKRAHDGNLGKNFVRMKEGSTLAMERAESRYKRQHPDLLGVVRRKYSGMLSTWGDQFAREGRIFDALSNYFQAWRRQPLNARVWKRFLGASSRMLFGRHGFRGRTDRCTHH